MKNFSGSILFLDRSDINTDEIIPARYLTEATKAALKPYCLEDLRLEGFDSRRDVPGKNVIVTRSNFGCGSSREHAAWTLECNNITMVIAVNFARIFRQNMFNCGMIAATLAPEEIDEIFKVFSGAPARCETDFAKGRAVITGSGQRREYSFEISGFDRELVAAGGWLAYADRKY